MVARLRGFPLLLACASIVPPALAREPSVTPPASASPRAPEAKRAAEAPRNARKGGTPKRGNDKPADAERAAAAYFPDVTLVDQDGRSHRFFSDLLKGKRVIVNFGFTRCNGACNPITRNLVKVQKALGDRVGRDIVMLTISVDPARDTPASMKEFANKYGAGPGWYFLSGAPENVHAVLRRLGADTQNPDEHSTMVLLGDVPSGTWTKAIAYTPPDELANAVLRLTE
jgi:cytochrome oxidase Cu insertion factor (SCO1/SenC/PrrC family)